MISLGRDIMKRIITALAALIVGVLAGWTTPLPAAADVPPVSAEVTDWFNRIGQAIVSGQCLPSASPTAVPDDRYQFPFGSAVGTPVPVMMWTDEFLAAARPTADMLVPSGDWIAPISSEGQGVGTISVEIDNDGQWQHWWDTDASAAAGLLTARPQDIVVVDPLNGVFVIADSRVRQYGDGRTGAVSGTVAQLQAALLDQRAEHEAQVAAGGELTGETPIDFAQWVSGHPDPLAVVRGYNPWWFVWPLGIALAFGVGAGVWNCRQRMRSRLPEVTPDP